MKAQAPNTETITAPSDSGPVYTRRGLSEAEIEQRAYEIYQSRGCEDGADLEDWLRAERELNEEVSVEYAVSAAGAA